MKRQKLPHFFLLLILLGSFGTCDLTRNSDEDPRASQTNYNFRIPPFTEYYVIGLPGCDLNRHQLIYSNMMPQSVRMEVELINNTNEQITIYGPGGFFYGSEEIYHHGLLHYGQRIPRHSAGQNSTSDFDFRWYSSEDLSYQSFPSELGLDYARLTTFRCDICFWRYEREEEIIENWKSYIMSFFLEINIGSEVLYLAGWPQSIDMSAAILHWWEPGEGEWGFSRSGYFDHRKIAQYGIGYANNDDPYVVPDVVPASFRSMALPYNIHYPDAEGRPSVFNGRYRYPMMVVGKAVLTIDAPDKIEYRVVSIDTVEHISDW